MSGFESDLRLVREARSRTLEHIQQETRIPLHVLKRFEEGDLVDDPTYGQVYLVALLRSYARAVGIPQPDVLAGYERARAGIYRGELNPSYDGPPLAELPPPAPAEPAVDAADAPESGPKKRAPVPVSTPRPTLVGGGTVPVPPPVTASPVAAPATGEPSGGVGPVPAPSNPVEALRAPTPPPVPTVPPPMRVARPAVPGARRSYDKNWGGILALCAVVIVAIGAAVYFLFFRPDAPADDALTTADGVAAQIDSAAVGAGAAGGRVFQTPISVVVTAMGNGLQSFRVTEDSGDRKPYWIAAGESQTFTADSALVFSGEGSTAAFSDASLEWQGIRWTPADGRPLAIDRATGQRLLDSLAAAPASVPAAAAP